jgi:hypothetical protein
MKYFSRATRFKSAATIFFAFFCASSMALMNEPSVMEGEKAQVALLGVFHFTNPGLDVVKTKQVNVFEPENQAYLVAFSDRIAQGFKPTKVLVECARKSQPSIEDKFSSYLNGTYQLGTNEIYQLGFRIAKASNASIICYDERDVHWQASDLTAYMKEQDTQAQARADSAIKNITEVLNRMHSELSLKELLIEFNSADLDTLNKSLYIGTNDVGAETNFYGADATASWWHRNFRMYANIQKAAAAGERVLVIGGQGHTAILRDILSDDLLREAHSLKPYF